MKKAIILLSAIMLLSFSLAQSNYDGSVNTNTYDELDSLTKCEKVLSSTGIAYYISCISATGSEMYFNVTTEIDSSFSCREIVLVSGENAEICRNAEGAHAATIGQTSTSGGSSYADNNTSTTDANANTEKDTNYSSTSDSGAGSSTGETGTYPTTNTGSIIDIIKGTTTTTPTDGGEPDYLSNCERVKTDDGRVKIVCGTEGDDSVSTAKNVDATKIKRCEYVLIKDGERITLCETIDNELVTPSEEDTDYDIVEGGIKYTIREKTHEYSYEDQELDELLEKIEQLLDNAGIGEEDKKKYKDVAEKRKLRIARRAKVEKIVKETEEIKSKFTLGVSNDTESVLEGVSVVETVPKEIADSASEIESDYEFMVLQDDPVLEFIIPILMPGESAEVAYSIGKDVSDEDIDAMEVPVAKFDNETSIEECGVDTAEAEGFDLTFSIRDDALADVTLELIVPYSEACLALGGIESASYSAFKCPSAIESTQDAMFRGMGFFTLEGGSCNASYSGGKIYLDIRTVTDMIVTPLGAGNSEVTFRDWQFVESEAASSLKVIIPEGTRLTSYYPRTEPEAQPNYELGEVFWPSIPMERPSIKYQTIGTDWALIGGMIVAFVVIVGVVGLVFFIKKKNDAKVTQAKFIKLKMQKLEQKYMLGQMDETTYRRLMEQYQMQLNEIESELSKKKAPAPPTKKM